MEDINTSSMNYNESLGKYKINRKFNSGRIVAISLATAATITALGLGTIKIQSLIEEKSIVEAMAYTSSYDSFSDQIENMLGIDLDSSLEEDLNSMRVTRETIDDYFNDNSLISKADALKILVDNKNDFEKSALHIAKSWCSNEYGGDTNDWKISLEDSQHPIWVATNNSSGTHTLTDDNVCELLFAIGNSQSMENADLVKSENPDKFVSICDKIAKYSGVVASDIAQNKTK